MMQTFDDVAQIVRGKITDTPVFCFRPDRIRRAAQAFASGFPGKVLYAVKANPHPVVLQAIVEGRVTAFDTASIAEIVLARGILPEADCSYNHPVKPRSSLAIAYRDFGVRDYVVDHPAELDKLLEETGIDLVVQVRVAMPNPDAMISFNSKFGATPEKAVELLRLVRERGATPALSTHLGYQTTDPGAYARGLRLFGEILSASGVTAAYLNLGGGFPSILMPHALTLEDYFRAIAAAHRGDPNIAGTALRCEPGSAIAHPGGTVLAQVLLVKDEAVYINDGVYGALAELIQSRIQPPTRVLQRDGTERCGSLRAHRLFGPTCDSYDTIPALFGLPDEIREGDWLECQMMGAYSHTLITDFNGVGAHEYALLRH